MAPPSAPPPAPAAEAVLTFLESVGRRSEAEAYLDLFRKLPKESFALIAPGAPVMRQGLSGLAEQLRFLRDLGLVAPVLLGLFDPDTGESSAERLAKRFDAAGVAHRVHRASGADLSHLFREELRAGITPIVVLGERVGKDASERLRWVAGLADGLGSRKLVWLRRRGGLRLAGDRRLERAARHLLSLEGSAVSLVNLRTDHALLAGLLAKRDAVLLELAQEVLADAASPRLVVSLTSPLDLLRELFTVKGAGTLIKRGAALDKRDDYAGLDRARLTALFEQSFRRPLAAGFFDKAPLAVYVEQDYRGAAVVQAMDVAPYLSKFAVEPLAQGEGMGRDLWQALSRDFPKLVWRTRAENPTAGWYQVVCDGLSRHGDWHVFWRGVDLADVPTVVDAVRGLPDDFGAPLAADPGA